MGVPPTLDGCAQEQLGAVYREEGENWNWHNHTS